MSVPAAREPLVQGIAEDRRQRLQDELDGVNLEIGQLEQALDVAAQRDAGRLMRPSTRPGRLSSRTSRGSWRRG